MLRSVVAIAFALLALAAAVDIPSVPLMNAARPGLKMPVAGIGTWGYGEPGEVWNDDIAEKAVSQWLALGGRRIDGANDYHDQPGVAKAVNASGVARSDIFITSKLSPNGYNETLKQMTKILSDLNMSYVDLLLIHWPGPPFLSTDPACKGDPSSWKACRQSVWKAMTEIYNSGQAHAIGVSNFERNHLDDIIGMGGLIPAVNQVEFHPYWHEDDLVAYCKMNKVVFNSYAPLGTPDWAPSTHNWNGTILQLPAIQEIAKVHNRTAAQVIQRWEWQQGVVVNPRTKDPVHMKENLNFFDFELVDDEMKVISNLPKPKNPKVCPDPHIIK